MVDLAAFRLLVATLADWLSGQQQEAIAYLIDENRILRAPLGGRRMRLTDAERCRLAVRGHRLGRKRLSQVATVVTPDTILRWHRQLIARKWTYAKRQLGRPGVRREQGDRRVHHVRTRASLADFYLNARLADSLDSEVARLPPGMRQTRPSGEAFRQIPTAYGAINPTGRLI